MNPQQPKSSDFRQYLIVVLTSALASLAAVALFNLWVDPYRLFRVFPESPITATKARPSANIGQIKVLNAARAGQPVLIMGNSRADIGFNPQHRFFTNLPGKTYNAAVPGAGVQQVRDDFEMLVDNTQVKTVLLAVDFQDFVLNAQSVQGRPADTRESLKGIRLARQFGSAFTLTGTQDSIATLLASRDPYAAVMGLDGLNPMRDYAAIAQRDGYPSMFRQRLQETAARYVTSSRGIFPPGETDSGEFAALRDIVSVARKKNIDLYILTYPYHAQYYLLFAELGLWDEFSNWKRTVLETVEGQIRLIPCDCRTEFWDFSVITPVTTAPVVTNQARAASQWYWEAGHFKASLGDLVLDQLSGPPQQANSFGSRLAAPMIEPWLQGQSDKLDEYRRQHPEELIEVRNSVRQGHRP